jgi:cytochrome c553
MVVMRNIGRPSGSVCDDSLSMRRQPSLFQHRNPLLFGRMLVFIAAVLVSACTDRMNSSDDRWGRSGELIAVSGGEGGARYACVTCHGASGEGNGFDAPRLAGLPTGYLQKQMEDYAAGLRPHEVMRDVARFLDSDERVRVALFYAALPPQALRPANQEPLVSTTEALYVDACGQCHGSEGVGTANGPPLNAQPAFYLAQQLQDWQVSKRRNDGNHVMLKAAQQLKPDEVIQLSLYLARIPTPPPPLAR